MTRVPSPKRYCLLRAGVCSARQSWFLVGVHHPESYTGTPPPGRRNHPTPACYPSHSPSHGYWHSKLCWPTPEVTASIQYRPEGIARAGKLSCRAVGTAGGAVYELADCRCAVTERCFGFFAWFLLTIRFIADRSVSRQPRNRP